MIRQCKRMSQEIVRQDFPRDTPGILRRIVRLIVQGNAGRIAVRIAPWIAPGSTRPVLTGITPGTLAAITPGVVAAIALGIARRIRAPIAPGYHWGSGGLEWRVSEQ